MKCKDINCKDVTNGNTAANLLNFKSMRLINERKNACNTSSLSNLEISFVAVSTKATSNSWSEYQGPPIKSLGGSTNKRVRGLLPNSYRIYIFFLLVIDLKLLIKLFFTNLLITREITF